MTAENIQDLEEILNYIYQGCEKEESGLITSSSLIKFIEIVSNGTDNEVLHQKLIQHFDKEGLNLSLDFDKFRELMTSFIHSARLEGSFLDSGNDCGEKNNPPYSPKVSPINMSRFSNCSTFSNVSTEAVEDESEDVSALMDHYKSFSLKMVTEKVALLNRLNVAEDQIIQLQGENKALKEVARSLESTKDLLHQKTVDLEEAKSRLAHYQEQCSECEDNIAKLELATHRLRAEAAEARNRMNSVLKDRDEVDETNACLRAEIEELNEVKLKTEKSLELYKMLYLQKSDEYQHELKKCQEISCGVEILRTENGELQSKLKETEEKLREKEDELSSFIHHSSLGSIDEEDIPMRLISKNHKSFNLTANQPSLCQELRLSLMDSPAFPSPMRDLELKRVLASSYTFYDGTDSFQLNDTKTSDASMGLSEEDSNFLKGKRVLKEGLKDLIIMADKAEAIRRINIIVDDFIGTVKAKISADCLSLNTEITQQSELNEVLQQQILDLEEKMGSIKQQFRIEGDVNSKELEIDPTSEDALSTGYASLDNVSKSSEASDLQQQNETIADLELSMIFPKEDPAKQVAWNDDLAKQTKKYLDPEAEAFVAIQTGESLPLRDFGVHVDGDQTHHIKCQNCSKAPVTCPDISSTEGLPSGEVDRVLAAGDSEKITNLVENYRQRNEPIEAIYGNIPSSKPRRKRTRGTFARLVLWASMFLLATVTLLMLEDGLLSELITGAINAMPTPELRYSYAPPT